MSVDGNLNWIFLTRIQNRNCKIKRHISKLLKTNGQCKVGLRNVYLSSDLVLSLPFGRLLAEKYVTAGVEAGGEQASYVVRTLAGTQNATRESVLNSYILHSRHFQRIN